MYDLKVVRSTMVKSHVSSPYRIVLLLRDLEGYSTKEVAELPGISETHVKVRLHRNRAALKKRLEPVLRGEVPR